MNRKLLQQAFTTGKVMIFMVSSGNLTQLWTSFFFDRQSIYQAIYTIGSLDQICDRNTPGWPWGCWFMLILVFWIAIGSIAFSKENAVQIFFSSFIRLGILTMKTGRPASQWSNFASMKTGLFSQSENSLRLGNSNGFFPWFVNGHFRNPLIGGTYHI